MTYKPKHLISGLALVAALGCGNAFAFIEDGDARRAILELRAQLQEQNSQIKALQRSLMDMDSKTNRLEERLARQFGANEELTRRVQIAEGRVSALAQGFSQQIQEANSRIGHFEPATVSAYGQTFSATPLETSAYQAAKKHFSDSNFKRAEAELIRFLKAHPGSGYVTPATFWLGGAQYAQSKCRAAVQNFESVSKAGHRFSPDAALNQANCLQMLKDTKQSQSVLKQLIKDYPKSDAAEKAKKLISTQPSKTTTKPQSKAVANPAK